MDLTDIPGTRTGMRQEADIPPVQVAITAYQQEEVVCPGCGKRNQGSFPAGIVAPFQIGLNLKSFVVYLNVAHHIPFERLTGILSDLLSVRISQGTVDNTLTDAYRVGASLAAEILRAVKRESWAGSDETGTRVNGDTCGSGRSRILPAPTTPSNRAVDTTWSRHTLAKTTRASSSTTAGRHRIIRLPALTNSAILTCCATFSSAGTRNEAGGQAP